MKFNILDHMKKILISFGCLLLVGILVLSIFGLNLGQELKGNIQINVNIGRYNIIEENDVKAHTKKITDVLKENGAKVLQTNIEDGSFDAVLVVTVKNCSKERSQNVEFANKLQDCVKAHYNNDELLVVTSAVNTTGSPFLISPSISISGLATTSSSASFTAASYASS